MEHTLKITNVLSDPTRFSIYQYMIKHHQEVTVSEIADQFTIHPNVARLHLSKLEDINLLISYSQKTGKGGRPGKLYRLSEKVVELHFPHRDYKLLASIALQTFAELGKQGEEALFRTGKEYGAMIMEQYQSQTTTELNIDQKIRILEEAGTMLGMYPKFSYQSEANAISLSISNCPFKEVTANNHQMICKMHHFLIKGMFQSLFTSIELLETENMFQGCETCTYVAKLSIV